MKRYMLIVMGQGDLEAAELMLRGVVAEMGERKHEVLHASVAHEEVVQPVIGTVDDLVGLAPLRVKVVSTEALVGGVNAQGSERQQSDRVLLEETHAGVRQLQEGFNLLLKPKPAPVKKTGGAGSKKPEESAPLDVSGEVPPQPVDVAPPQSPPPVEVNASEPAAEAGTAD